ncbi:MAG: JmjC domain-containing protein [Rhodanobacteraceae bacterium]
MKIPPIEVSATRRQMLGMPAARFLRDYWQERPLLVRNAFPDFASSMAPDELAGLACMDGALARIVLRTPSPSSSRAPRSGDPESSSSAGRNDGIRVQHYAPPRQENRRKSAAGRLQKHDGWSVRTGPFDDDTFAKLPNSRWTLLVQDADKWDADTAALLDGFMFIPNWRVDDVMVSYAVDGGGVGAHVDQYDVFLLQGLGRRRWAIDTRLDPPTAFREDVDLKLLREFNPTHEWILDPGDMLYLPPGIPHDGTAVGECMTFSIGMRAPAASELLLDFTEHLAEALPESQRYSDPDLVPATAPGEIDNAALRRVRRTLGPTSATLDDDAFTDWFGSFVTRYRCAQVALPRKRPVDSAAIADRLPQLRLRRDPWSRFAWRRKGRDARIYVAGTALDAPVGWARVLASGGRVFDGADLAKLPQPSRGIALLVKLINAGHVTYRHR